MRAEQLFSVESNSNTHPSPSPAPLCLDAKVYEAWAMHIIGAVVSSLPPFFETFVRARMPFYRTISAVEKAKERSCCCAQLPQKERMSATNKAKAQFHLYLLGCEARTKEQR